MILDSRKQKDTSGVVIDTGTGKRVPKVIWFDVTTGDYECHVPAPNGHDVLMDEFAQPIIRRGSAVGKLELIPLDQAANLGQFKVPPKKVHQTVQPLSKDEKVAGLELYKDVYITVWQDIRKVDKKTVNEKWLAYLRNTPFLDSLVLRRRSVPTGGAV
jgi:hypothetical protein